MPQPAAPPAEPSGRFMILRASAGSGKTFVLVERFMRLVREGVRPDRILTITFTERAALEMTERIGRALEAAGHEDARRLVEGAWISTIHGFCARLLRERALEGGVDPSFFNPGVCVALVGALTEYPRWNAKEVPLRLGRVQ